MPRGAYAHLCRLPTQKSAPRPVTSTGSCPGACAASTRTGTPARGAARRRSAATGNSRAVAEVIWSTMTSRVRRVQPARTASTTSSSVGASGSGATRCTAPVRRAQVARRRVRTAPYPWSVVTISSPGCRSSDCEHDGDAGGRVADQGAAVRVGAEEGGEVPAGVRDPVGQPRVKNRSGLASISSRSRCWARCTPIGTAPNEPWLRWATAGSSEKSSRAPGIGFGRASGSVAATV